jgi:mercuric ion binding protein
MVFVRNKERIIMKSGTVKLGCFLFAVSCLLLGPGGWQIDGYSLAAEAQELQTITLRIEGMSCGACVKDVRVALSKVPGVKVAEVKVGTKWFFLNEYSDARAIVTCERGKTTADELIKAVEAASSAISTYKAKQVD